MTPPPHPRTDSRADSALVASVAMHSSMGDPKGNLAKIELLLRRAQAAGATFVLFPEECITGSLNKSSLDDGLATCAIEQAGQLAIPRLERLCSALSLTVVAGTIEQRHGARFNSALVVGPEGHIGTYDKMWLPKGERKCFHPGTPWGIRVWKNKVYLRSSTR